MQAPTKLLAQRFRFRQSLDLGAKSLAWIAVDEQSGREVVAAALPGARLAALLGIVGLRHPHIATIVELVHDPDPAMIPGGARVQAAGIAVAELVRGPSLHQALKQNVTEPSVAISWWLGLCEAVRSIHSAGGAHGAISPRSIVVNPSDGRAGPVLTQLVAPSSGAYCAPERLQGRGPSTADDVWALPALTGSPPFKGDTKDQLVLSMASGRMQPLSEFGVREPDLQALLEAGLTADLARRRSDISALADALEQWQAQSERTVAIPAPLPYVPDVRDWDEDAATVIADSGLNHPRPEHAPAPAVSVPPVPVVDDVVPGELVDEDDATTIMHQPRAEEIEAAIAQARARAAGVPYEVLEARAPIASEPPTEIMNRDELMIPRAPALGFDPPAAQPPIAPQPGVREQFPSYDTPPAPPPQAPSGYAPKPAAPKLAESGFPPPISAFPPPISRPPPAGPDLAQVALSNTDVEIRKAGRGPLIVIFTILILIALGIGVAMFFNYRSASVGRGANDLAEPPGSAASPSARA